MAEIRQMAPRGMITLRGEPAALAGALGGLALPGTGQIIQMGDRALAWMSPDEFLLLLPQAEVAATLGQISQSLQGVHHLAVDVTDARALLSLTGPGAREVIAKLSPADLHPAQFGPGQMRRTRLGQVAAAFWMQADGAIMVICIRSVADYVAALLAQSVQDGPVGYFG